MDHDEAKLCSDIWETFRSVEKENRTEDLPVDIFGNLKPYNYSDFCKGTRFTRKRKPSMCIFITRVGPGFFNVEGYFHNWWFELDMCSYQQLLGIGSRVLRAKELGIPVAVILNS